MWRNGLLLTLILLTGFALKAQFDNYYTVSDNQEFDKVEFSLKTTNGQCLIEPGKEVGIMDIYSKTEGITKPQYEENIVNRTKVVKVKLDEKNNNYLSATISKQMFGSRPMSVDDYTWKVYLSKLKPMDIDLRYAVGDTYVDLSDLPIERLKIKTGSANVRINYNKGLGNQMEMDTFMIVVDMGTFEAKNIHLSRSGNIIADVGFGNVQMDFGDAEVITTEVRATVGAGKLEIILPHKNVPVKININDSPLCHIKMPKEFQETTENVFITPEFNENQANYINFNVDVVVGSIVFKTASH